MVSGLVRYERVLAADVESGLSRNNDRHFERKRWPGSVPTDRTANHRFEEVGFSQIVTL